METLIQSISVVTSKGVTINLNTTSAQTVAAGVQVALILGEVENAYGGSGSDNLTGN